MRIGALEIIVILLVALVVFGGSRLSGVGKALGQSIREFKKEVKSDDKAEQKPEETEKNNEQQ